MKKLQTFKARLNILGWIFAATATVISASNSHAAGTIVFRGLATGIDSSWVNNTSGTSYATWVNDGTTAFARIAYTASGDYGLNYKLPDRNRSAIYVKMWCRQNGDTSHGPKHFKIFGQVTSNGYANTTIGLAGYGKEYDIYYGDSNVVGSGNDNSVEWRFTGATWQGSVFKRAAPTVVSKTATPPLINNSWHEWGYYVKFNDAGQQNGEVIILYDGKEIFHLVNVYNRADGQSPIDNFGIGQYINAGAYAMTRDYRDVRLAYDGWPDSTDIKGNFTGGAAVIPPSPPSLSVTAQ